MKSHLRASTVASSLLLAAAFLATAALGSCGREGGSGGGAAAGPHLRKESRVEYYLNTEANDLTEVTVRETFERWGKASRFEFVYKGRNRAGLEKDGKNTVSFLLKWPPEIPIGKVAYCRNWYDRDGNIVESDIIFNMAIAKFTTLRTKKPDSYYIEGVLAHEIGHMIGLDHIEDDESVMRHLSSANESFGKGELDEKTLNAYRALYPGAGP